MSGRLLILLLLFCSCKANPTVHVSGAVRNPGTYPSRPLDTYASLVEAAGGTSSEADTALAFIIREIPDSAGRVATRHIPAKQLQKLGPGDTVHIPFRTYPVTLDSLAEVRNVNLTQAGRRYRLGTWTSSVRLCRKQASRCDHSRTRNRRIGSRKCTIRSLSLPLRAHGPYRVQYPDQTLHSWIFR